MLARWGVPAGATLTRAAQGHINESWRVDPPPGQGAGPLLLQRLNPVVFPAGDRVMRNLEHVTDHLARAAERLGLPDQERQVLRLVPAADGAMTQRAPDGAWWRLVRLIEHARPAEPVRTPAEAREVGLAFGRFAGMLSDYAGPPLEETLSGFHDTAARLRRLEAAAEAAPDARRVAAGAELTQLRRRHPYVEVVPSLRAAGALATRITHNDAKADNVLVDTRTGAALAVIDLDTVMPGVLLHDVGDLLRSVAGGAAEDEVALERIRARPELVEGLAQGYFEAALPLLSDAEREHFLFSGILLAYEQAIRFLTDYLAGDVYYRIARPTHNLDRTRAQLRLVEELEGHRGELEEMIMRLARSVE